MGQGEGEEGEGGSCGGEEERYHGRRAPGGRGSISRPWRARWAKPRGCGLWDGCEGERDLEGFYPGGEEVEGHADLGAEAGGYAGEGVEGRWRRARWPERGSAGA